MRLSRSLPPGPAPVAWGLRPLNANAPPFLGVLNGRLTLDGSGPGRLGTAAGREAERLARGQAAWGRLCPLGSAERSAPRRRPCVRGPPRGPLRGLLFVERTSTLIRVPTNRGGIDEVLREVAGEESCHDFDGLTPHPFDGPGHADSGHQAGRESASRLRFDLRSLESGAACKGVSVRESALVCLTRSGPTPTAAKAGSAQAGRGRAKGCPPADFLSEVLIRGVPVL